MFANSAKRVSTIQARWIAPTALLLWVVIGAAGGYGIRAQGPSSAHAQAEELRRAGVSQATAGHISDAIASFQRGLALEPRNAGLLEAAGAAYSMKGDLETARTYFEQSLDLNPDSISTRQNLGIALFSLGRYDDAALQFSAIQHASGRPQEVARLFLGLIAERRSDCPMAIQLLEASKELLQQYPDALLSYAGCEQRDGKAAAAGQALRAFDRLPSRTPEQNRRAGEIRALVNAHPRDESGKSQLVSDAVTDDVLGRAVGLAKANRLEEALQLLEDATAAHPTFDLLLELAEVAKKRSDFAIAMRSLKRASEIEPGREDSYLEFSTICAEHGNDQLALDTAEIGLEHVPDSYRLSVQKGAVQEKLGHLSDAEETLRKAMGMQKDNSIARLSLAVVLAHGGKTDAAEETLAEAIAQFPDNYYMHYFRAKLLLQFANTGTGSAEVRDLARHSLEKSIQLNPRYADSYYQLSSLYVPDSPRLAEQALHKCLQLDPSHIPAQYALARLYLRNGRKAEGEALLRSLKAQQHTEESEQQKQLRIEIANN